MPVAIGVRARVRSLGVIGEVIALPDAGEVELAVGGKRLRVPRSELIPLAASAPRKASRVEGPARGQRPAVPAEINLVGLTVDEALPRVDKLLDDAALSDRRELRVIHGFGQGACARRSPSSWTAIRTWRRSAWARRAAAA